MNMIETIESMATMNMATDPLTTIPLRASTRSELEHLKTGGQTYDELIRAILEELEARDPWFDEMEGRIDDWRAGKAKLEPVETLRDLDRRSRKRGTR